MAKKQKNASVRAACYVRMSTDDQENSPERQRADLERFAERQGYEIVEWYEDHGISGTDVKGRHEFQRLMMESAQDRFDILLACELSRLSREEPLAAMARFGELLKAGVQIETINGRTIDFSDIGSLITTLVGSHGAHDESKKLAERGCSGKRSKLDDGIRVDGQAYFGYAREMTDEAGEIQRIVRYDEKFRRPERWKFRLIPDPEARYVNAVRWMFQAVLSGKTVSDVARELNRRELRTSRGMTFTCTTVRRMLQNPVYKGVLRFGEKQRGKFQTVSADGSVFWKENAHEALIDADTFDRVNSLLANRPRRSSATTLPLSGILACPECGGVMYGNYRKQGGKAFPMYVCSNAWKGAEHYFGISASVVDNAVLHVLASGVFTRENVDAMLATIEMQSEDTEGNSDAARLQELDQQIETAAGNLALAASVESFAVIERQIQEWHRERDELARLLRTRRGGTKAMTPEATAIERLVGNPSRILNADPSVARSLVAMCIAKAVPQRTETGQVWDFQGQVTNLTLEFRPGFIRDGKEYRLSNLDLGLVNCHESVLRVLDGDKMGVHDIHTAMEFPFALGRLKAVLQELRDAGLIEKVGASKRWARYRLSSEGNRVAAKLKRKQFVVRPSRAAGQPGGSYSVGLEVRRK